MAVINYSSGLPPSNDDTDSTHSSSNRSINDVPPPHHMLPPVQLVGKGKQLPKVSLYHVTSIIHNSVA